MQRGRHPFNFITLNVFSIVRVIFAVAYWFTHTHISDSIHQSSSAIHSSNHVSYYLKYDWWLLNVWLITGCMKMKYVFNQHHLYLYLECSKTRFRKKEMIFFTLNNFTFKGFLSTSLLTSKHKCCFGSFHNKSRKCSSVFQPQSLADDSSNRSMTGR